jgi:hypothetical protein
MNEMPILRFELDGVRSRVAHMLSSKNDELNELVLQSLDRQLTQEWVMAEIDAAVKGALLSAIRSVGDNYTVRSALNEVICGVVSENIGKSLTK